MLIKLIRHIAQLSFKHEKNPWYYTRDLIKLNNTQILV